MKTKLSVSNYNALSLSENQFQGLNYHVNLFRGSSVVNKLKRDEHCVRYISAIAFSASFSNI